MRFLLLFLFFFSVFLLFCFGFFVLFRGFSLDRNYTRKPFKNFSEKKSTL